MESDTKAQGMEKVRGNSSDAEQRIASALARAAPPTPRVCRPIVIIGTGGPRAMHICPLIKKAASQSRRWWMRTQTRRQVWPAVFKYPWQPVLSMTRSVEFRERAVWRMKL
jgi:hypothetical protein